MPQNIKKENMIKKPFNLSNIYSHLFYSKLVSQILFYPLKYVEWEATHSKYWPDMSLFITIQKLILQLIWQADDYEISPFENLSTFQVYFIIFN